MWRLINRGITKWSGDWRDPKDDDKKKEPHEYFLFHYNPDIAGTIISTMGEAILELPYSVALRTTICRMLAKRWDKRISSRELLETCRAAIRICEEAEQNLADQAEAENAAPGWDDEDIGARVFNRQYDEPLGPQTVVPPPDDAPPDDAPPDNGGGDDNAGDDNAGDDSVGNGEGGDGDEGGDDDEVDGTTELSDSTGPELSVPSYKTESFVPSRLNLRR